MIYAVHRGRKPGTYNSWEDCKKQVDRFPSAWYKKCKNRTEAMYFVKWGKQKPYPKITCFFTKQTSAPLQST